MATTISTQDLLNARRDIDDIGEAVNEVKIVSPRYGEDFKSLPMIADEAQATIGEWEAAISLITQEGGVPALAVSDASGVTQQEINDLTGAPYRVKAGGYNIGERVVLTNGDIVKSTINGNTNDPNVDMTGWQSTSQETIFVDNKDDGISVATDLPDGSTVIVKTDESVTLKGSLVAYTVISGLLTTPVYLSSGMVTPSAYGIPMESESLANQDTAFAALSTLIHPAKIYLDGRYRVSNTYVTTILPRCTGQGAINGIHPNNDAPFLNEQIIKPSWFSWNSGIKPYYALDNTWKINVTPQSFDVAFNAVGKVTKYVDTALGNDSNTGDAAGSGNAWKSVNKALTWAKLNQGTVPNLVIMIQAGLYDRNSFWVAANATPTAQNISMRAVGGKVYLSKQFEAQSWTLASGLIYQTTRSAVGSVWDSLNLDSNGYWSKLKLMGTTQASVVAAGQWATNGTTVWVWNTDSRAPDANNRLMVTGAGSYITNLAGTLYCEGISFFGGDGAMTVKTDNSVTSKQYFNDCEFAYSTTSNGLNVEGTDGCYIFNSRVFRAHRDGLNYHINADLMKNFKAFEFNVVSKYNGMSGDSNNNASTCHDGGIIQRVGGEYAYSEGPNLPDVNGCLTWNTGIIVHDSMSPAGGTRYGMYVQGGGKLHCDFCKSYNHLGDVVVQASTGSIFTTRGWLGGLDIVYS